MDERESGAWMLQLASELFPICRSVTGDGVRRTLEILRREIPLAVHEVPTGTAVLDWTVPREWNIREAWIRDGQGRTVIDFARSNLHVVGYSQPVRRRMSLDELRPHLHTLPDQPELVPYRTSYYKATWGFCLPHRVLLEMEPGEYEVCIDSTLASGSLTYGELLLPGETEQEILFSAHVCHPSLANDNLSGIVVAVALARELARKRLRHSVRFVFAPGTIGAITWLAHNRDTVSRIRGGLVLTCVGDRHGFTYKLSRRGDSPMDLAMQHVLGGCGETARILDFVPYGYDERQYGSPGFNLGVGCLMRSVWGEFPEYHTSADNLSFLDAASLEGTLRLCRQVVETLDGECFLRNLVPYGEPQLGRRGLYATTGGAGVAADTLAMLWVLNGADGEHSLAAIAAKSGMTLERLSRAADALRDAGLLAED